MEKSKRQEAYLTMVSIGPWWYNTDRVSTFNLLWEERMLIKMAMAGLMVEASLKFHTTVWVLSLPDVGVRHSEEALVELKTALWKTRAANSRSKFVMLSP